MPPPAQKPDIQELYDRYGRAVYRRCQYFLRSDADAEDALHEVFLKVVQNYEGFVAASSPLTWLVSITTHHCLNILRSRKAKWQGRYETMVHVDLEGRPHETKKTEQKQLVQTLLHKLDPEAAQAAVHYFVDEMSQDDAAMACGCSVPTLRKRLRAFIKAARKELKREDASLVFGEEPV